MVRGSTRFPAPIRPSRQLTGALQFSRKEIHGFGHALRQPGASRSKAAARLLWSVARAAFSRAPTPNGQADTGRHRDDERPRHRVGDRPKHRVPDPDCGDLDANELGEAALQEFEMRQNRGVRR